MKNIKKIVTVMVSVMLLATGCAGNETAKNEVSGTADTKVESKQEEADKEKNEDKKVVAGTVMAAELLDKLEVDVVGVPTTKKGLPKRYSGVTDIGMSMKPDAEKIA